MSYTFFSLHFFLNFQYQLLILYVKFLCFQVNIVQTQTTKWDLLPCRKALKSHKVSVNFNDSNSNSNLFTYVQCLTFSYRLGNYSPVSNKRFYLLIIPYKSQYFSFSVLSFFLFSFLSRIAVLRSNNAIIILIFITIVLNSIFYSLVFSIIVPNFASHYLQSHHLLYQYLLLGLTKRIHQLYSAVF